MQGAGILLLAWLFPLRATLLGWVAARGESHPAGADLSDVIRAGCMQCCVTLAGG